MAVKIQRPGIRKHIKVDLEIMIHLATLMERHIEDLSFFRPIKIVEEFAQTLEKEMDYTLEASFFTLTLYFHITLICIVLAFDILIDSLV